MNTTDITDVPDDKLDAVRQLVKEMQRLEKEAGILEDRLDETNKQLNRVRVELLPDLMLGAGIQSIRLADGSRVTVEKFYNAKIPDALKPKAFAWLDTNGYGGIIKTEVTTLHTRGDRRNALRAVELLKKHGFVPLQKDDIHWQTLRAWVKEQIEGGNKVPVDLFGVYIGNKATVKK